MHTESNKSTKLVSPHDDVLTKKIALDCEMMRSNIGQVLGRVSVVNYEGKIIFDTFVCYPEPKFLGGVSNLP
jgi:RNA exonuclease 4